MKKCALIDKTKKYRYWLLRQWGPNSKRFVNFVMLNPSKADAQIDDNTIKRCVNFAKAWNYDGIYVTNLFAFRTTYPMFCLGVNLSGQPKHPLRLNKKTKPKPFKIIEN